MDNKQQGQQSKEDQTTTGNENPTLQQPGTSVADYGNVTGGSSDTNVEEGQNNSNQENNNARAGSQDTVGNP